ncbi:uncharacterized protein V1510DRAFT_369240 [Dipodascopsis tothii]|uniref:uncharacterized protein n=1 Tax=Dipodascopsis tothii TaxID=44089 RepID=UPI0034CE1C02
MALDPLPLFLWCTGLTVAYVGCLYVYPATRPSATVFRDDVAVIKARVVVISITSVLAVVVAGAVGGAPIADAGRALYLWPLPSAGLVLRTAVAPTLLLFAGPVLLRLSEPRELAVDARSAVSWIGLRNYIVGPLTEEIVFRGCMVYLHLLAGVGGKRTVLTTPLYFGIAHAHHALEVYLADPRALKFALISAAVQFVFTTIFGWYAALLLVRTGSVWVPTAAHALCNSLGVPHLGALPGPVWRTHAYRAALVGGAVGFRYAVGPLTAVGRSLV